MKVAIGGYVGQTALQAEHPVERGDRPRGGDDHPAVRLRDRDRDGAADRHRRARAWSASLAVIRLLGHVTDVPERLADARDDDRARGRASTTRCSSSPATSCSCATAWRCASRSRAPTATAGGAVVFAGGTVVIALCSLFVRRHPARDDARLHRGRRGGRRRARGDDAAAGAARRPRARASIRCASSSAARIPTTTSRTAGRAGPRGVAARPWRSMVAGLVVLVVLAVPVLSSSSGRTTSARCPRRPPRARPTTWSPRASASGANGPLLVGGEARHPGQARPDEPRRDLQAATAAQRPSSSRSSQQGLAARAHRSSRLQQQAQQQTKSQSEQARAAEAAGASRRPPTRA